jgi:hypothetical protein
MRRVGLLSIAKCTSQRTRLKVCLADHCSQRPETAVNFAATLGEHRHRVLHIDLDPQASASAWLGFRGDDGGLLEVFTDNVRLCHLTSDTRVPNVDIVPASPWLVGVDKAAAEVGAETLVRTSFARLPDPLGPPRGRLPLSLGFLAISTVRRVSVAAHPCRDPRHGTWRTGGPTANDGTRAGATES